MVGNVIKVRSEAISSEVDPEILRLKRQLVADDVQGHSCDQCKQFMVKPPPSKRLPLGEKCEFFRIDTTEKEVREAFAAQGCRLWAMIRDQLAYVRLESKVKQEDKKVEFDHERHERYGSDKHFADLAASMGGSEEKEFWHLRRNRGVFWGFASNANGAIEFAVNSPDFVRVIMGYSSTNDFTNDAVTVDVRIVMARQPAESLYEPYRGDEIWLDEYWTQFLVLALPGTLCLSKSPSPCIGLYDGVTDDGATGDLGDMTRKCISAPVNLNPGSHGSMDLIRQWIRECEVEHECGFGDLPMSMPSMLLDVSDRDQVRLIQVPSTMRERYVTLSYCWGSTSQSVMLNRQSRASLELGISPHQTDPTICDSITVARELGFRFLWVDALCIPQDQDDGGEFKARELGKMGDIYRNATFTIAASAAKDVREGFLNRRVQTIDRAAPSADGETPNVFRIGAESVGPKAEASVVLWPDESDEIEPWYHRAWTLQELLFSGRRLQYRAHQTTWVCYCGQTTIAQECDGWIGAKGHVHTGYSDGGLYKSVMALLRNTHDNPPPLSTILKYWYDLVEEYSRRRLAYSTDRLPAISGIAKGFASVLGGEYLCGLWKSDVSAGLLWYASSSPAYPTDGGKRSKPSWSWASHPGGVYWALHSNDLLEARQNEDFQVLSCDVDLAAPNATFGDVRGAQLRVRGLLKPIPMPEKKPWVNTEAWISLGDQQVSCVLDCEDDPRLQAGSQAKFRLLLVMNHNVTAWGILLVEEDETRNEYSRVGVVTIDIIWPIDGDDEWDKVNWKPNKTTEECRDRLRSLWGSENGAQSVVLI
ncbi:hypothetical protein PG989_000987 [Apiospora arundinis]